MAPGADKERRRRSWIAALLGYGEFLIDMAVALALIAGGAILLGVVVYDFVRGLGHEPVIGLVLELLSGLLLVFIFTELVSTIRVVIARRKVGCRAVLDRRDGGSNPAPDRDQRRGGEPARDGQVPGPDARDRPPGRDRAAARRDRVRPPNPPRRQRRSDHRPDVVTTMGSGQAVLAH